MDAKKDDFLRAYRACSSNRKHIEASTRCACYRCRTEFRPADIAEWIPDTGDETALCPRCGTDTVIPGNSGLPLDPEFLAAMGRFWEMGGTGSA